MGINKITMNTPEGEQILIDLTDDSVTPETLAKGMTAHNAAGDLIEGKMPTETVLFTPQVLSQEEQAQARENIGAGLPPMLIDLDTYGEIPLNLILGSLFLRGGGVEENVDIGSLMQDIDTDRPLHVKFTMSINLLRIYSATVVRQDDGCVELCITGMFVYNGIPYLAHMAINATSYEDRSQATIVMSVEEPGEVQEFPVQSVNGQTGAVQLSAADVGARPDYWMPTAQEVGALPNTYTPPNQTAEQVGADPKGTAASAVSQHNTADDSHNDIRLELKAINDRLNAFFDSDNQTLDELSEIVAYITNNKSLIDSITTSKVSVADIINNLTTNVTNKPLSAAQGVVLKGLIDTLNNNLLNYQPKGDYALASAIPTKVSQLTNDSGFIKSYTETDPTVPAWAKASTKPSYSKSEVGLGNVDNVKQYSSKNPPVVYQSGAPTDTSVVWVDADDNNVDEFQEAVDAALAQAKASGEFNPVKGTDYWTEADQEEIVQQVIAVLGTPVFGRVDAEKNIVLSGSLAEGNYTVKYEDATGNQTVIGSIAVGGGIINMIPISKDADGSVYNDIGYKGSTRLSGSGVATTLDGHSLTGFIPITFNDVMYGTSGMFGEDYYDEIAVYTADKTFIKKVQTRTSNRPATVAVNDDGTWSFTPSLDASFSNIAYVRVCAVNIDENSIITINQPLS